MWVYSMVTQCHSEFRISKKYIYQKVITPWRNLSEWPRVRRSPADVEWCLLFFVCSMHDKATSHMPLWMPLLVLKWFFFSFTESPTFVHVHLVKVSRLSEFNQSAQPTWRSLMLFVHGTKLPPLCPSVVKKNKKKRNLTNQEPHL